MNLCSRCIVLDRGTVSIEASVERAIEKYLCGLETSATVPLRDRTDRKGNGVLRLTSFGLRTGDGSQVNRAQAGQTIVLEIGYASRNLESQRNVHVAIGVHGGQDENLFQLTTTVCGGDFPVVHGDGTFHCRIHSMPLQPGRYPINLFCTVNGAISDWIEHAAVLDVEEGDFFSSGRLPAADQGPLLVAHEWNCVESSSGSGVTTPLGQ